MVRYFACNSFLSSTPLYCRCGGFSKGITFALPFAPTCFRSLPLAPCSVRRRMVRQERKAQGIVNRRFASSPSGFLLPLVHNTRGFNLCSSGVIDDICPSCSPTYFPLPSRFARGKGHWLRRVVASCPHATTEGRRQIEFLGPSTLLYTVPGTPTSSAAESSTTHASG